MSIDDVYYYNPPFTHSWVLLSLLRATFRRRMCQAARPNYFQQQDDSLQQTNASSIQTVQQRSTTPTPSFCAQPFTPFPHHPSVVCLQGLHACLLYMLQAPNKVRAGLRGAIHKIEACTRVCSQTPAPVNLLHAAALGDGGRGGTFTALI
jgi:hypothetical protein